MLESKTTPFQYFECRPCIQNTETGNTISYTDENRFNEVADRRRNDGESIVTFWTIFGVQANGEAVALVDDVEGKDSAFDTLAALLAPFRAVLAILDDGERKYRIKEAADLLRTLIDSCSTPDRI